MRHLRTSQRTTPLPGTAGQRMSQARRGGDFERAVVLHLRADGYDVVRSAASKGAVDVVAFKSHQVLFVNCKLDPARVTPAERVQLWRLGQLIPCALPIVAWKKRGTSRPQYVQLTGTRTTDKIPFTTDELA
jgi:Holliday junction resolvase